jgi:hypothetical protein
LARSSATQSGRAMTPTRRATGATHSTSSAANVDPCARTRRTWCPRSRIASSTSTDSGYLVSSVERRREQLYEPIGNEFGKRRERN